jgi:DNA-binding SARP family transcriptional activator/TolB-like protein/Tfp pilus assembly protein PilF
MILVRFRLRLLGRLELSIDDRTSVRLSTRKAGALIAYLAMTPAHTASREELATLLWGSCSDQQARQSLRQALVMLRKDLKQPDFIKSNTDRIELLPGQWWVDACEFERLTKSFDGTELAQAAGLFGGEFLAGFSLDEEGFDEWVAGQRQRMQRAAARLCETLAARPDLVVDGEQALGAVERLLALDPLREDWQRIALTLYARYRGKSEALSHAEEFAALLRRELAVAPERRTQELVASIRDGAIACVTARSVAAAPATVPGADAARLVAGEGDARTAAPVPAAPPPRWPIRGLAAAAAVVALGVWLTHYNRELRGIPAPAPSVQTAATQPDDPRPPPPRPGMPDTIPIEVLRSSPADPWRSPPSPAQPRDASAIDTGSIISIAVLPFTSYGESAGEIEMIAGMMTDDLTNLLSRNRTFRVISRATARSFKDRAVDLATIGTELQVRYVLEGSVRMLADKLRVNVELIDSASRTAVWSGRIERDGADQHGVQDEIVGRLARELHFEILPVENARRRDDPSAVALVYRGHAAMNAAFAKTGNESFKKAESLFREALERDPDNLQAMVGLGAYHANIGAQALTADSKAHLDQAREILTGVLARAPNNGAAPFYLGLVHSASGKLDDALAAFTRAVEINPSHASAHAHIGHALARMGRASEGLEHLYYAMRLSPRDPNLSYWFEFVGGAELALDHLDKAIENFSRSHAINPGYPRSLAGLAAAHALAGNIVEARKFADRLRALAQQSDVEVLVRRFGRNPKTSPQLHDGLRQALAPPTEFSRLPATSQH